MTKARIKDASGTLLKELRFTYDVVNRRVGVWVDGDGAGPADPDQVWTVYDGANPYMDFDGEGQLQARYLYGPGIDELFARIGTGEDPQWFLTDRLGSVRQIVNAAGTVLDEISYDSFGGILNESNPAQGDRFKFTGREYCPELGLYYYRARWYDPAVGRFISQDIIGFQAGDPNLYRYVGNAPGDARDPTGLVDWWNPFSWGKDEWNSFGGSFRDSYESTTSGLAYIGSGDQQLLDEAYRLGPFGQTDNSPNTQKIVWVSLGIAGVSASTSFVCMLTGFEPVLWKTQAGVRTAVLNEIGFYERQIENLSRGLRNLEIDYKAAMAANDFDKGYQFAQQIEWGSKELAALLRWYGFLQKFPL